MSVLMCSPVMTTPGAVRSAALNRAVSCTAQAPSRRAAPRPRARTRPGGRFTEYGPVTTARPAPAVRPVSRTRIRVRIGVALAGLALLGALVIAGVSSLLAPGGPGVPAGTAVIQVQPGDTLSGIAAQRAPSAPRQATVDRIVALNGLTSPSVRPGQTLTVPAAAPVGT